MPYCPKCDMEFIEGITVCSDCGGPLYESEEAYKAIEKEETAKRLAEQAAQIFYREKMDNVRIVVNRVRPGMIEQGDMVNIDRAMDLSGLGLLGVVPEDRDIIACGNAGKVLMLYSEGPAVTAYQNIARRLKGEKVRLMKL